MSVIIESVVILFALIFLGYYLGKMKIVRQEAAPDLSSLVLRVTMPATVFLAIASQSADAIRSSIWMMPAMLLFHVGAAGIGVLTCKIGRVPKKHYGVWIYNCMLTNNGFMGLPLAQSIYGSRGLILMALGNVVSNILIFSVGIKLTTLSSSTKVRIGLRQVVFNNVNIAVVAGFFFCLTGIHVPDALTSMMSYLGDMTSGLSMIVVGISLSNYALKKVFQSRLTYQITLMRLIVVPLLTIFVIALLPIPMSKVFRGVLILSAALPASAAQSMLAEEYGGDTEAAGCAVLMTTMLSVCTIPLVMMIGL